MSSSSPIVYNSFYMQRVPVLQPGQGLKGRLDWVQPEPGENGLLRISVAGVERLVAEELDADLLRLTGKKVSIIRIGDEWRVVGL